MTTEEAKTRVGERMDAARAIRSVARRELDVLDLLWEALIVNGSHEGNLAIILEALEEDKS